VITTRAAFHSDRFRTQFFANARVAQIQNAVGKFNWGVRVVGLGPSLRGLGRLAKLQILRPNRSCVHVGNDFTLGFAYPSQVPSTLVTFGNFIDPEFALLRDLRWSSDIVLDVGAAIGQFSLFAATMQSAEVHAYEPSSANLATLRENLERNSHVDLVSVHQVALSNHTGEASFVTAGNAWISGLSRFPTASGDREIVPVRTLPDELKRLNIDRVSILKLNVAGFEPEVLEGAVPVFEQGRVDLLILLLGIASLDWYARIAKCGYRFFYYHPREKTLYEVRSFDHASVLDHRPWPARHIIAIHPSAFHSHDFSAVKIKDL
jgi:FkbM family methyltransferase